MIPESSNNHIIFNSAGKKHVYFTKNNLIAEIVDFSELSDYYYKHKLNYTEETLKDYFIKSSNELIAKENYENIFSSTKLDLTLSITNECSLRCKYCIYSGIYEGEREHSEQHMSNDTIENVINFIKKSYTKLNELNIAFYGGEPTLQTSKIIRCITLVNDELEGIDINYSIATNGVYISDALIQIFKRYNFSVQITLDGSEYINDYHRVNKLQQGSYHNVINTINKLNESSIFDITIACTLAPPYNMIERFEYFTKNELIKNYEITFGWVVYNDEIYQNYDTSDLDMYVQKFNNYVELTDSLDNKFHKSYFFQSYQYIHTRVADDIFLDNELHRSFCSVGRNRLLINADGNFSPCEQLTSCNIGDIDNGFDFSKIIEMNKEYLDFRINNCSKCWAVRLCFYCQSGYHDSLTHNGKNFCDDMRIKIKDLLSSYTSLYSKNPEICKELTKAW